MSIVESLTKFAQENPILATVYVGGMAASILAHSCFKASKFHSEWKKKSAHLVDEDSKTEAALTTVLQGAGVGFLRGLVTCSIWPVEATAVVYVTLSKDSLKGPKKD